MPKKASELGALDIARLTKPGTYAAGGVAGLHLQISPTGTKSWFLRVVVGGKRRKMGLGAYPGVGIAHARRKAQIARDSVQQGIDPIDAQISENRSLTASRAKDVTFRTCAELHIAAHKSSWKNEKHESQWERTLETYAYPLIGDMMVRDVTLQHVMQILEPIWHTKPETANRVRGRIESVLASATTKGLRGGVNPAAWKGNLSTLLPAKNKITKSKHFPSVPVKELPAFFDQLRRQEGTAARALEFLILTNVRSHNVRHASWSEIDLETNTWLIPGDDSEGSKQRMKAGVTHRVPLAPAALKLLESIPKTAGTELIFPSPRKSTPLSDMAMSKLMKGMEANGVPHGFRSTFRNWASEMTNFPREVTERAMAHRLGDKTEAAYMRSDLFERRTKLMEAWASYCTTLPNAGGKVVQMRSGA
ncbi:phage integrase [Hydrogenophaga sp. RAC07]|uniref:tyrosine-type recombinase/integrase n=1 Tax=Hydrogenophaga sp. RAC07 TaxID=1842537 RepID=UPI00083E0765|nr:site-specific integrase [Hydrogenophaga sp. RAC07]AOF87288.1 phage integrase [Hydrogenophaga sp. RAC07]